MPAVIRKSDASVSLSDRKRDLVHAVSWTVRSSAWSPPTDAYETDDAYIIRVELAGMRDSDFEITVENGFPSNPGNPSRLPGATSLPANGNPVWAFFNHSWLARSGGCGCIPR